MAAFFLNEYIIHCFQTALCGELSDFSDLGWITELLSTFSMREVDIITIATGISHLEKVAAASR